MSEIVAKLREYNRWRRGDEGIAQPDPGEIGKCIDAICDLVGQFERERDMAEDERIDLAKQLRSEQERHAVCQNERDEAREQIKELIYISERAIALAEIDFENDKFGVVSELRDGLEKIQEAAK